MKILLIDGDEAVRLGAAEILAMNGFEADTAADAGEASRLLASGAGYGLVVLSGGEIPGSRAKVKLLKKPFTAKELIDAVTEGEEN